MKPLASRVVVWKAENSHSNHLNVEIVFYKSFACDFLFWPMLSFSILYESNSLRAFHMITQGSHFPVAGLIAR